MSRPRNYLIRCPILLAVLVTLSSGRQFAQAPSLTISPQNPTAIVGQTVAFVASGAPAPASVSAGGQYTCVSLPDGTLRCAGRNQFGQLGDGSWTNSSTPVVPAGINTASRAVAGDEFGCALMRDGTAMCWGLGEKGQRGDGTFTQIALTPIPVQGIATATALGAGYNHACALLGDATMRCWGSNTDGQLGDPLSTESSVPIAVPNLSGVAAMSAGAFHTCAIVADRTARCWGGNGSGQVGDGTTTNASTPVPVAGLSNVVAISGGDDHTCAVITDGTVWCWGNNFAGQLGDGTGHSSTTPVQVTGITNALDVSAGWGHTCARLADGTLRCWGENSVGQLGDGTTNTALAPVTVAGITNAVGISAGWWHHSCALLNDGGVRCWGINDFGQFGNGTTGGSLVPVAMSAPAVTWTSSNPSVATIDGAGRATSVAAGATTITATDTTGATASTTLTAVLPNFTLTVVKAGLARDSGSVGSNPAGISCGANCSKDYVSGTVVTLTASPALLVTGWSGCDTAQGDTCTVRMTSARSVTVNFMGMPFQP